MFPPICPSLYTPVVFLCLWPASPAGETHMCVRDLLATESL
jgi:hypothetical protein